MNAVNMEDNYGQTPLHLAAMQGHNDVVSSLVSRYHCEVLKKDRNNLSALDHAINKKKVKTEFIIRFLNDNTINYIYIQ